MAMTSVLMLKWIYRPDTSRPPGLCQRHFHQCENAVDKALDYTCISKLAKSINVPFKTPTPGEIAPLVIKH
ncbi:MAG: IS5/IS1182 family transposase, partial [Serratia symbiotica]|nr:IS5/IS1182 family transposase [Serratia symbiotica]